MSCANPDEFALSASSGETGPDDGSPLITSQPLRLNELRDGDEFYQLSEYKAAVAPRRTGYYRAQLYRRTVIESFADGGGQFDRLE